MGSNVAPFHRLLLALTIPLYSCDPVNVRETGAPSEGSQDMSNNAAYSLAAPVTAAIVPSGPSPSATPPGPMPRLGSRQDADAYFIRGSAQEADDIVIGTPTSIEEITAHWSAIDREISMQHCALKIERVLKGMLDVTALDAYLPISPEMSRPSDSSIWFFRVIDGHHEVLKLISAPNEEIRNQTLAIIAGALSEN